MKAVLLSAGKGSRMYPLTRNTPKCLLEIGDGVTVLENQMKALSACPEIEEIIVVAGYLVDQVEAKMSSFGEGVKHRIIYNPFYDIADNIISLWVALPEMDTDTITINGDNVFSSDLIKGLINEPYSNPITMTIDRKEEYDDDDMKVIINGNRVCDVSKKIEKSKANGESVGIIKYSGPGLALIKKIINKMIRDKSNLSVFYLSALKKIMESGFPVNYYECDPKDWAEIDFHPDLALIQDNMQQYLKDSKAMILDNVK